MSTNRKATTAKKQPAVAQTQTDQERERVRRRAERRARIQARVAAGVVTRAGGASPGPAAALRARRADEDAMDRLNDPDERETDLDLDFD
jgi:hypothetical protein